MAASASGPYRRGVRVRRFLSLWCSALLVVAVGGLTGPGEAARALLVTTGPERAAAAEPEDKDPADAEATVEGPVTDAGASVLGTSASSSSSSSSSPPPGSSPSSVAAGSVSSTARPRVATADRPSTTVPPAGGSSSTTAVRPPAGLMPCTVSARSGLSTRPTGEATAGSPAPGPGLYVDNCRPLTGDYIWVQAFASTPGPAMRVAFGDGTSAGAVPGDCSAHVQVTERHRYAAAGRYLLEASEHSGCEREPSKVYRVWIEVTAGAMPEAPGAAPCHGLGPVKPGEPARQGRAQLQVPSLRFGELTVMFNRCAARAGAQSELVVLWYQPNLLVDWGDGTPPQAFHEPGRQNANVIHTWARRGLHTVTLWIVVDGKPAPPATFTALVS